MEEIKLIKFLNGTASPKEEHEVIQWLNKPESRKEFDAVMEKFFENPAPKFADDTNYDQMLSEIHSKTLKSKKTQASIVKIFFTRGLKIAASVLLVLFCAYMLIEGFTYSDKSNGSEMNVSYNTRSTGPGEKLTLIMSDKSRITVNSNSEISFSSEYGKSERVVNIKGEAYFEVAPDPKKPFKVISNSLTTTALGTEFNVYARKNEFKIALVEGKVAVVKPDQKVELSPGSMVLWNSLEEESLDFLIESFDKEKMTLWKEGKLSFNRKPLGEILNDLSEWYSVDIQIDKNVDKSKRVIGTFDNKNLKDILTGLSFTLSFDFEIDEKNVHIKKQ